MGTEAQDRIEAANVRLKQLAAEAEIAARLMEVKRLQEALATAWTKWLEEHKAAIGGRGNIYCMRDAATDLVDMAERVTGLLNAIVITKGA